MAAEQQIHLRAQRFARVQAGEMRLYHADVVQVGRRVERTRKPAGGCGKRAPCAYCQQPPAWEVDRDGHQVR